MSYALHRLTTPLLHHSITPSIAMPPLRFFNRVSKGHGERSEPSLNRSDDFPARDSL